MELSEKQGGPKTVWRPVIAAALSLVFAGLGHLYLRQYSRGAIFLVISGLVLMLSDYKPQIMLLNVFFFIFSAFDAFSIGKRGFGIL